MLLAQQDIENKTSLEEEKCLRGRETILLIRIYILLLGATFNELLR